jgi:hypothetical protein
VPATVSALGSGTFTSANGTKTVTATPAVGDLIFIVTAHANNTAQIAPTDNNSGGGGTYSLSDYNSWYKDSSTDTLQIWVRNALITSATSTTFTHAPGSTSGGGLAVVVVQGVTNTGTLAIQKSGGQDNQSGSTTPAPSLGATPNISRPVISAVYNSSNPANVTARSGYTTLFNLGHAFPGSGLAVIARNSGETSATITWGGNSSAFASIALELSSPITVHATTGVLTGQGSTIVGSASRKTSHATTGVLTGQSSTVAGTSAHIARHTTTGALTGPGSTIAGSASRFRQFATSGTLTGPGSTVTGSSTRFRQFTTSGTLTGPGSTVTGSASRFRQFATSGTLTGPGSTVTGSASRFRQFATSGTLTGPGAAVTGSSIRFRQFATTGALTGPGSTVTGLSMRSVTFNATGALVGQGSALVGNADHISPYPNPELMPAGLQYGPGGVFIGTLTIGDGASIIRLRSGTERK